MRLSWHVSKSALASSSSALFRSPVNLFRMRPRGLAWNHHMGAASTDESARPCSEVDACSEVAKKSTARSTAPTAAAPQSVPYTVSGSPATTPARL